MRDYADKANLHARLYAMRSRLLSLKDYLLLVGNHDEAFYNKTTGAPDPIAAGEVVFKEQIANIIPLAEANSIYVPIFLAFFRQFEALNAKLVLAKTFGLQSLEQWHDIGSYFTLKRSLFRETTTLQDIRPLLTGTYLEEVLEDVSSYEQMEIRVDLCAARSLYEASALFTPDEKLDFQNLTGRRIAVTSTMLSLRLKKTYQWEDEKIHPFLERFHDVFEGKIMAHVKIVKEALDRYIEQVRSSGGQEPDFVDIEHYLEQYYYNWISSMFHRDFNSISCVVAYLWLLYYQIRNLLKIIEGRRFGFSPDRILARIVCNRVA